MVKFVSRLVTEPGSSSRAHHRLPSGPHPEGVPSKCRSVRRQPGVVGQGLERGTRRSGAPTGLTPNVQCVAWLRSRAEWWGAAFRRIGHESPRGLGLAIFGLIMIVVGLANDDGQQFWIGAGCVGIVLVIICLSERFIRTDSEEPPPPQPPAPTRAEVSARVTAVSSDLARLREQLTKIQRGTRERRP